MILTSGSSRRSARIVSRLAYAALKKWEDRMASQSAAQAPSLCEAISVPIMRARIFSYESLFEIVGQSFALASSHNSPIFHRPALGRNHSALAFALPTVIIDNHPIASLMRLMRVRGVGEKRCVMQISSCGVQNR